MGTPNPGFPLQFFGWFYQPGFSSLKNKMLPFKTLTLICVSGISLILCEYIRENQPTH
jgi:hypothetical protein